MHIVDGVLSTEVVVSGAVIAVGGIAYGLRSITIENMPRTALLSAVFFVASLIHVPIGPTSIHLIMNGLLGLILGWAAFPAVFIALLLQAVFFGFGGITVLGVNTVNMALPAVLVGLAFSPLLARMDGRFMAIAAFLAGASSIMLSAVMVGASLALSGQEFIATAKLVFINNMPIMVVEGFLTAAAFSLIKKVRPAMLLSGGNARATA
ncbi:cobalt transporter CbiM [Thalassospira marina]|uniref:Cobalamin biosynthesis protein CbiM n=1 Tax=Thalassospira marina TaxID=2048283 RepID=A0A2N3KV56_9PROT|nr:cobalt transporter CbiM [Thalassospira marina]AUG52831.1 cobalamin biosynthesis protein CbiM [Thalassospira marina]PKR54343.1 cobalamin biosynthesis protein CbiM [Thalassospira marina]